MNDAVDFQVRRDDLRTTRLCDIPPVELEPGNGQALLRVDHFAFTANNITYAVAGDLLSYWNFFPAERGWGRVPVWGFADVVASRCDGVREGSRLYGYYPMSTHLVVSPVHANDAGFIDGAAHRASMAGAYNQYRTVGAELAAAGGEEAQMLLQPLFVTAFLIDDFLAESRFFGARAVVLSSASSKTSFALAHQLSRRGGKSRAATQSGAKTSEFEVIGLTSPRNAGFVTGLGCYGRTLCYGDLSALDPGERAIFVDMAGNGALQSAVHHHYGANLVHSLSVGMTHWQDAKRETGLPGAEPSFFFAPNQLRKRFHDWGPEGFQTRIQSAFEAFRGLANRALRIVRGRRGDVPRVYLETLEGHAPPDEGHVLSLHAEG